MNATTTLIEIPTATPIDNPISINNFAKVTEWSVLAVIAVILIKHLMKVNAQLTSALIEEAKEDNAD